MRPADKFALSSHLKTLRLPSVLRVYEKTAADALKAGCSHEEYLLMVCSAEVDERDAKAQNVSNGTGKTHLAISIAVEACRRRLTTRFFTVSQLVEALLEARSERSLGRLRASLKKVDLLVLDELGFVPLPASGAELLFDVVLDRYERGSIVLTTNLPFEEWVSVLASEPLTHAMLDRLTHHVHILQMNGRSYRLVQSLKRNVTLQKEEYHAGD